MPEELTDLTPPDSAGALAEQRHQTQDPAVPPLAAAGPGLVGAEVTRRCPTPGCGSLTSYVDTTARRADDWILVQPARRPDAARWYCGAACAAAALASAVAPGVAK